jgi:hypothetical protein
VGGASRTITITITSSSRDQEGGQEKEDDRCVRDWIDLNALVYITNGPQKPNPQTTPFTGFSLNPSSPHHLPSKGGCATPAERALRLSLLEPLVTFLVGEVALPLLRAAFFVTEADGTGG